MQTSLDIQLIRYFNYSSTPLLFVRNEILDWNFCIILYILYIYIIFIYLIVLPLMITLKLFKLAIQLGKTYQEFLQFLSRYQFESIMLAISSTDLWKRRRRKIERKRLTGISALETFVKLEGEGNVDLHHLHLRYARRMCHYASTPSKHQFVAVNTKHDHIPVQRNRISHLIELFLAIYY